MTILTPNLTPKDARYARIDEYLQNAKTSLAMRLATFDRFTIGYYYAIFRFLTKGAKLIGAFKCDAEEEGGES